jgi:HSP20 family protein
MNNTMKCATPRSFSNPFIRASFPGIFDAEIFEKDFSSNVPAVNISENDKSWNIEVAAPGFKKEDFKIKLENDVLTVSAEHKQEENAEEKNYRRREFKKSSFSRSFRLKKENVNEDGISASYDNGILNLILPKKEEVQKESLKEIKIS